MRFPSRQTLRQLGETLLIGTIGGALIGLGIGRAFDGTALPFLIGMAGCAILALVAVALTEPNRFLERLPRQAAAE